MGKVVFPTHSIITEISQTIQMGYTELAARKLQLLDKKFWEYRNGEVTPEIFASEIGTLK
ncbi:MAG: hypothetical protein WCS73_05695 [Lentisphaeria bacterium]